jgi:hypothetical protein
MNATFWLEASPSTFTKLMVPTWMTLAPMTRKTWVAESCVADLKACYSTESSTVEVH